MVLSDEEWRLIKEFNLLVGEGDPIYAEIQRRGLAPVSWDYQPEPPDGPMYIKLVLKNQAGQEVASSYGLDVRSIRASALRQILETERS